MSWLGRVNCWFLGWLRLGGVRGFVCPAVGVADDPVHGVLPGGVERDDRVLLGANGFVSDDECARGGCGADFRGFTADGDDVFAGAEAVDLERGGAWLPVFFVDAAGKFRLGGVFGEGVVDGLGPGGGSGLGAVLEGGGCRAGVDGP